MTHIENILPEMVGSEVVGLSLRDADGLAAAALYDLVRKATGCRLPQTDSTPSSEVEELLALCSAVLRRHWQTPLTMLDGLSLQDLVSRLMADRMEGNAPLGIPAVNGSVTEALSALLERKITGAPEVADGMSLVQLLCGSAASASLTTLTDPTTGWTMGKELTIDTANIESLHMNCVIAHCHHIVSNGFTNLKRLELPELVEMQYYTTLTTNQTMGVLLGSQVEELYLPKLVKCDYAADCRPRYDYLYIVGESDFIKKVYAPNLVRGRTNNAANGAVSYCSVLREFIAPKYEGMYDRMFMDCPQLIHIELDFSKSSVNLSQWSPTMALRTDTTAEDYVDLREDTALSSNLLQFLSNFREFLFLRLADRTGQSALTLTLSQAVYQAITGTDTTTTALTLTLNQLGITDLTEKEVEAGITLNTTYATWLETYRDAINWNIGYV